MSALVTIGIPCFNSAQWIGRAVESALKQTWPACEVIVVDDGSTDSSLDVLRGFGDAIRLVETSHRGGNHARNVILKSARGEWLQFLDADDYLETPKIETQLREADEEGDVLYSPVIVETARSRGPEPIDRALDVFGQWISWQLPQTGGGLWRREALERIGGWNEAMPCCQEHELYLRALKGGLRFRFTPTPHAVYRIWSEETVCRRDPAEVVHTRTRLIEDMCAWLRDNGRFKTEHAEIAGRACFEMARTLARFDLDEAEKYHRRMQKLGLIRLAGPAAPLSYRAVYWLAGFHVAELLARSLREKNEGA